VERRVTVLLFVPAAIVAMPTLLSNLTLPTVRRATPFLGPLVAPYSAVPVVA
jgi:hypothetical protein